MKTHFEDFERSYEIVLFPQKKEKAIYRFAKYYLQSLLFLIELLRTKKPIENNHMTFKSDAIVKSIE